MALNHERRIVLSLIIAAFSWPLAGGCETDNASGTEQDDDSANGEEDAPSEDEEAPSGASDSRRDAAIAMADGGADSGRRSPNGGGDAARPIDASRATPDASSTTDTGTVPPDAAQGSGDASPQAGECTHQQLRGTDICTIGDSWIQIPGNQVTTVEDHMKMAGVIPEGDSFDRREVSGSTLSAIIRTYDRSPMNCKILIMDGGGIDLFVTPAGDEASVAPIVQRFEDFLAKVAADGYVQHIIYSLYPVIPSTPNLNVNMKPGFSEACEQSAVDCHLVDLEPLFMGDHFAADQTHANNEGGKIIGNAWWKTMQENCIGQ